MLEMPEAQGQSLNIRLILAFSICLFFPHMQPEFNLMPATFQMRTAPLYHERENMNFVNAILAIHALRHSNARFLWLPEFCVSIFQAKVGHEQAAQ